MWFVAAARARSGMSMQDRIAAELVDAYVARLPIVGLPETLARLERDIP